MGLSRLTESNGALILRRDCVVRGTEASMTRSARVALFTGHFSLFPSLKLIYVMSLRMVIAVNETRV